MKTIVLTASGSARVEDGPPADTPTTSDTGMKTPYRLWQLTSGPTDRLAYVQRSMKASGGAARPVYRIHDRTGTDEVRPETWKEKKATALQTDAMAEAGAEGVQLIDLARKGRVSFPYAVDRIEQISRSGAEAAEAGTRA